LDHSLQYKEKENLKRPPANLAITILALVLIIVFTFMLTDYFKQVRLQTNLRAQIDRGKQNLASLESPSPGLEQKLAEARNENASVKSSLSNGAVNPRAIIEALLETAGACQLKSNNLTAEAWQEQTIGGRNYRTMPVQVNLRGTVPNLLVFIEKLENKPAFPSLIINNFSMAGPDVVDPEQAGSDVSTEIEAKLSVSIVVRTGQAGEEH
jgi:hypothetical protein